MQSAKKHAVERLSILQSVYAPVESGCAGQLMHATDLTVEISIPLLLLPAHHLLVLFRLSRLLVPSKHLRPSLHLYHRRGRLFLQLLCQQGSPQNSRLSLQHQILHGHQFIQLISLPPQTFQLLLLQISHRLLHHLNQARSRLGIHHHCPHFLSRRQHLLLAHHLSRAASHHSHLHIRLRFDRVCNLQT